MQVGSFHEAYQLVNEGPNLQEISNVLNMVVSKKNKSVNEISLKNPYMMGFPSSCIAKHLKTLVDNNYKVIVIDQQLEGTKAIRQIQGIYQNGMYIPEIQQSNNDAIHFICIFIQENRDLTSKQILQSCGISIIDVTTGKIILYEIQGKKNDENYVLDEISKIITLYQSKRILLINDIQSIQKKKLEDYLELQTIQFYHKDYKEYSKNKQFEKLSFQYEILKKAYNNQQSQRDIIIDLDLEFIENSRISLCILIDYIHDNQPNLIYKLQRPQYIQQDDYLNLGNNALIQLNLFTQENIKCKYQSLFDIINNTKTPMGKRYLKQMLIQPMTNVQSIERYYNLIEQFNQKNISLQLNKIQDIERFIRKIQLNMVQPLEFYNLFYSMNKSQQILTQLCEINIIFTEDQFQLRDEVKKICKQITDTFDMEQLQKYQFSEVPQQNIFHNGLVEEIDEILRKINVQDNLMNLLQVGLSQYLDQQLQSNKKQSELIHIQYNDKEGYFMIITKRRAEILEKKLKLDKQIIIDNMIIRHNDIEFKHMQKGNNSRLSFPLLANSSQQLIMLKEKLQQQSKHYFQQYTQRIQNENLQTIYKLINIIEEIDYVSSAQITAQKNNYVKPIIQSNVDNKSYLQAKQLRHPIIEVINQDEYKPINISLGQNIDGVLLYGLNSAGKSSLQKSIGIAIIMAQMGLYVAAEEFIFNPYNNLMTRINSNDNLFKGLSSFALELLELRAILKRSNKNTLVIADEVCKGTEHQSSLIIVQAMIQTLCQNQTSFITATHLHELNNIKEIKTLQNLAIKHLHITYNEQTNQLIYDRQLLDGSGESLYGLKLAKFFIQDKDFIQLTNEIKNTKYNDQFIPNKTSLYNKELYIDQCYICNYRPIEGQIPLETHHIIFQKDFKQGINKKHVKKNQKSNLMVLCQQCHDKIDNKSIIIEDSQMTQKGIKHNIKHNSEHNIKHNSEHNIKHNVKF